MKRIFSSSVALAMVLSMALCFAPSTQAQAAGGGDGLVRRRALAIGNAAYAESKLTAPEYDAKHMAELFRQMSFSGAASGAAEQGPLAAIESKTNRTRKQMLSDITAAFAGADADDVSYFYYSGHGAVISGEAQLVGVDMACLSLTDLKKALDSIPGTKVLLFDSCFSGGFISRSSAAPQTAVSKAASVSAGKLMKTAPLQKKLKKAKVTPSFPTALARKPENACKRLDELFNKSVSGKFGRAPAYMSNSSYIVLTAATVNEYSYELPFNTMYGPSFIMGGIDYANRNAANSGEFTGMLVAGAGRVTFNTIYGEIGLLADYNADRKITAAEMEHYLKGSVLFSDVSVYPAAEDTAAGESPVLFSQDSAASVPAVRVRLASGAPDVTTPAGSTSVVISLDFSGIPAGVKKTLAIYRYPKLTDLTAANGFVDQKPVRKFENVDSGAITWDGKDGEGRDAADGIYKVVLECGEGIVTQSDPPYLYPGVTLSLQRGCSDYTDANKITFSGGADGAPYVYSGTADIVTGGSQSAWFTAPVTGAMNVYADAAGLTGGRQAICKLLDADGNVVNYMISGETRTPYLPFTVEKGRTYRLRFEIGEDMDSPGDAGRYTFRLKLNTAVAVDKPLKGAGGGYESWLVIPGDTLSGDYMFQSQGVADPAATLVDSSQTSVLGVCDDYNDKNFMIKSPLLEGHGYLLVTSSVKPFAFTVYSPEKAPAFPTAGISAIDGAGGMGQEEEITGDVCKTVYRMIRTGSNAEKWSLITSDGSEAVDEANDPVLLLMDAHYNRVGGNDDYNSQYSAEFSAVLEPNSTYILACLNAGSSGYSFNLHVQRAALTASDYIVDKPKAVFTDNCGLSLDRYGNVSAWGINHNGELGLGGEEPSPTPGVVILPDFSNAVDIWAGETAGFARLEDNSYCYWGVDQVVPATLESLNGMDIAEICNGYSSEALIRTYTGELYLLDMEADETVPVVLPGEGWHSAVGTAATEGSYLALTADGNLFTWGTNTRGECGTGGSLPVEKPQRVTFANGVRIQSVAAGWDHVLALSADGAVYAWGNNAENELGQGAAYTKQTSARPVKIAGGDIAGKTITAVWAGADHSMCMDAEGYVYAWGSNAYGEFGFGDADRSAAPRKLDYYGPGKVPVQSMSAGESAVFAQDNAYNVYGYGSNEDYQLARSGQAPNDGIVKLMTLRGAVLADGRPGLRALHVSAGRAVVSGGAVSVKIPAEYDACYIVPEPADSRAKVSINGVAARGILVSAPQPGVKAPTVSIRISHPGGVLADDVYTLTVMRELSTNANLSYLKLSSGASLSPEFKKNQYSYRVTLPETLSAVTVTPAVDGYRAVYSIDSQQANMPRTYRLGVGQTLYSAVRVKAQSGNAETYGLTIARPKMLTALAGQPMKGGRASLSPGGTNRLTVQYELSFPATVKLEIRKGGRWVTLMTRKETAAGAKSWVWNGKVGGRYLAYGTYKLRMTPTYGGKACAQRTMYVQVYAKPTVSVTQPTPAKFKPDGLKSVEFGVGWSRITDVKVQIVNGSGAVVCDVYSAACQAPATRTFSWDGYFGGTPVPTGTYRVKVTCGPVVQYRSFNVQ